MLEKIEQIYCQRCLTANALGQELCLRCGTRLMLIVEPSTLRFEEDATLNAAPVEHLLERISTLEHKFARLADKLEQGFELLLRQAKGSYLDHMLLETLVEVLTEARTVDGKKLERRWRTGCERETEEMLKAQRREVLLSRILSRFGNGGGRKDFERLIRDGFAQLDQARTGAGIRLLERATVMASHNAPLNAYLGEHFFLREKRELAHVYLERAVAFDVEETRASLLLGLLCGDEGDVERAKLLLRQVIRQGVACFAAHYALGRLLVFEGDWKAGLAEFKRALAARPSAEAHYLVGAVYYQLARRRLAQRHLEKAIEMDAQYGEAWYLLGLAQWSLGARERAAQSLDAAHAANPGEPRYRTAQRRLQKRGSEPPPFALFGFSARPPQQLLTAGDQRLAAMLKEDTREMSIAR